MASHVSGTICPIVCLPILYTDDPVQKLQAAERAGLTMEHLGHVPQGPPH